MLANMTTLADVCESVRYGYTASAEADPVGPHFLRITDIVADTIDWASVPYCAIEDSEKERFGIAPGDVVVARTGATVGYAKMIRESMDAVFASYLVRFRVDPNKADPGFVGRLIESQAYKLFIRSRIGGAAQPNASAPVLGAFRFALPARKIQKRIVSILSAYDDLIENNRRRIQLLEQAARLLYKEWFVRLRFPGHEHVKIKDGVPAGWERIPLSEACEDIREQVNPSEVEPNTPYIGLEHIPRRSITLADWGTAAEVGSGKFRFEVGDILFGKIRPYFHKVGVALTSGITSSDTIVIRPLQPALYEYSLLMVSSDEFVALASKTVREGSKMPRADWKYLSAQRFLIPPRELLGTFASTVRAIIDQLKVLALQNRHLACARDILLPRLMNGEIAV